jgi:acetyl esterase/lipase
MNGYKSRKLIGLQVLRGLILASALAVNSCTVPSSPVQQLETSPSPLTAAAPSSNQEPNAETLHSTATETPMSLPTSRIIIATIQPGPYEVQPETNIAYTSKAKLDVYAPVEPGPWPVVVIYHGGLGTTKEAMRRLSTAVASYGAVVFVPNWRTQVSEVLEQGAEDAACAIRFARANAEDYGGDPARITGAGHSAGAMIVALMGLVGDEFSGDCLVSEGSGYLDGIAAIEGPYDMVAFSKVMYAYDKAPPEMWVRLSPMFYPAVTPPREGVEYHIFISDLMGAEEQANTAAFYNGLVEAGHNASLTVVPGVSHTTFADPLPDTVNVIIEMARRQAGLD